jgi:hypothetical protein
MDDRLLRELGELEQREGEDERSRVDERWDRLAAGTLTAEEEAELKALAESSPEARETYEAFRPLGADFQARMVAAAAAELVAPAPKAAPPEPAARLLPFRRVARRVEVGVGVAFAVAAGVFFLVHTPPLPVYKADPLSFQSEYRGAGSETATPGSQVTVKVRPDTHVEGKPDLDVLGFLSCAGGDLRPWPPQALVKGSNGLTFTGKLDERIQPGSSCRIWIVVARPGKAPGDLQAELREGRTGNDGWQAVSRDFTVSRR